MAPSSASASPTAQGTSRLLPSDTNQARGLAEYCLEFLHGGGAPGAATLALLERFHLDSVGCGVSALAAGTNAPTVLRREALGTVPARGSRGAVCLGTRRPVALEKGIAADVAAVREWDANGTNFGYDAAKGRVAGEFGHNDFYPAALAVAREAGLDGDATLRVMLLVDEIRGRLAEVFPLRTFAIDHVHHGAVACAAAAAAVLGGDVDAIESAIGMVVAHYVPFRAIRAGHQLSDSKGASAALSTEVAVTAARRALAGFVGPRDVFRNPLAIYRRSIPCPDGHSPFDLELGLTGDAFAIHAMHFKLGLYEHQSAGALQALVDLFARVPGLADDPAGIRRIEVAIYEPAFSIIADPAKRSPTTRQSADHSLPYIVARTILKASDAVAAGTAPDWAGLMLLPADYDDARIADPAVRALVERMAIIHGGPEYDAAYPDGIPTSLSIDHARFGRLESGLVRHPLGHARSDAAATARLVDLKFRRLVAGAVDDADALRERVRLAGRSVGDVAEAYGFPIHGCDPG